MVDEEQCGMIQVGRNAIPLSQISYKQYPFIQGWRQEFPNWEPTLPTRGLEYG